MLLIDVANDLDDYVPSPDALDSDISCTFCYSGAYPRNVEKKTDKASVSPNITPIMLFNL